MPIGTYVYYWNNPDVPIDMTIGIVMEIDPTGMLLIEWSDGFVDWYGPKGLVKI